MEEINTAPVIEPENTLKHKKKKFGKPEIFMILAVILGNGVSLLFGSFNSLYLLMLDAVNKDGKISSEIIYLTSEIINELSPATGWLLLVVIFILFAFLAYKKFRKSMRFFGIAFVVTQLMNYIISIATRIDNFVSLLTGSDMGTAEFIIWFVFEIGSLFIAAAVGVLLLMVVEGKFKKEENTAVSSVAKPENTLKHKKKKFGKPELFIILATFISFMIPNILSFIGMLLTMLEPHFEENWNLIHSVIAFVFSGQNTILILIVCVLFAVFAYRNRKIKNALVFIGVFFAAQNISQIFLSKPVGHIFNILLDSHYFLYTSNIVDMDSFVAIHTIISSIFSITGFIADFAGTVVMAVLAVIGLMIAGRKLKKKKKEEPETVETSEITEAN